MKRKVIDMHGDLFSHFTVAGLKGEEQIFKKHHLENFRKGSVYLSVFNVWIDDEREGINERAMQILSYGAKEIINNQDILNPVYRYDDIQDNDKVNFIIGLEGIDYLKNAEEIYALYQYGVRLISLTWNHSNNFAASITDANDFGLTDEGRKAIKIMNDLGIIIDISHLSDNSALEILEISTKPVIASHSNVRNIANHKRNLSDELIKKVAASGGIIGMNAYPAFIADNQDEKNIKGLVKHIDYLKELVGIEHLAFGFDFMDYLSDDATAFLEEAPYAKDLQNHKDIGSLINELIEQGYSEDEVDKITNANALRIIKEIIK